MFDEDLRIAMIIRGERRVKGLEVDVSECLRNFTRLLYLVELNTG